MIIISSLNKKVRMRNKPNNTSVSMNEMVLHIPQVRYGAV